MDKENVNNTEYIDKEDMNNEQESVSHDTLSEDNQNELIYQYPIEEMRGSYEDYFKQEYRKNKKTLYILAAMFFGALVSFMVYTSATSSRFSSIFLIIGIIILVLLSMTAKGITSKRSLHFLSINADEKCLTLTYYTQAKSYKQFCKKYQPKFGLKLSEKNLAENMCEETRTLSLPLYLAWNIDNYC